MKNFFKKLFVFKEVPAKRPVASEVATSPEANRKSAGNTIAESLTEQLSSPEKKAENFIGENVLPFVRKAMPNLSENAFWKSFLVKEELFPILKTAYEGKLAYSFVPKVDGFTLKGLHEDLRDQEFNSSDYDENLNEILPPKERAEKFIDTQIIPLIEDHDLCPEGLNTESILGSFMIKNEIMPILLEGYQNNKVFKVRKDSDGFRLLTPPMLQWQYDFKHIYRFEDYGAELKLRRAATITEDNPSTPEQADNQEHLKKIIEAKENFFPDEIEKNASIVNSFNKEGLNNENMAEWKENMTDVFVKMGLEEGDGQSLLSFCSELLKAVDDGEIQEEEDFESFKDEGTRITDALITKQEELDGYEAIAGKRLFQEGFEDFVNALNKRIENFEQ